MVLDAAGAELAYGSQSNSITLCTNEKYILETHKMLSLPNSSELVKEVWTNPDCFNSGHNIEYVKKQLKWLNYKSSRRSTRGWNWTNVANYYCLLAQGGFNYHFDRWRLKIDKNNPVSPDFSLIKSFSDSCRGRQLRYRQRNIFNFPINEVNKESILLYIHLPIRFTQYGCGYSWTKRKLNFVRSQLVDLARLDYKVCVSSLHTKWGREIKLSPDFLPPDLFTSHIYDVLKGPSSYGLNNLTREIFYAAGF